MLVVEAASLAAFVYPQLSALVFAAAAVAAFVIAFKNLEWGIYLLFGELFFGSRGHLLDYKIGPMLISVREVIFVAVFLAWAYALLRQKEWNYKTYLAKFGWQYWLLLAVVFAAILHGLLAHNGTGNVVADATAYLFLGIVPAVWSTVRSRQQLENLLRILAAALIVITLKTLLLFIWFSFALGGVATLYHWVLSQNIGEITGEVGTPSRVFLPSQFYALVGLFIFAFASEKKNWWVIAAAILAVILSLSRSFWLGGIVAAAFAAGVFLFFNLQEWWRFMKLGGVIVLIAVLELAGLFALTRLGGGQLTGTISNRINAPSQDAAGSARLFLLPELLQNIQKAPLLGQGLGYEVTYTSFLPDKITPSNPQGQITNYRFEWGYLDLWLKLGFLGLVVYLLFIARIFQRGWKLLAAVPSAFGLSLGFLCGLVAMLILNLTTPYLNHPLGVGFLILAGVFFSADAAEGRPS